MNIEKCQKCFKNTDVSGYITLLQCGREELEYAIQMEARARVASHAVVVRVGGNTSSLKTAAWEACARIAGSARMHEVIVQLKLKLMLRTVPGWKMIVISSCLHSMFISLHKCISRTWISEILLPVALKCYTTGRPRVLLRILRNNLVPRVLRLFDQRIVARRDFGKLEFNLIFFD